MNDWLYVLGGAILLLWLGAWLLLHLGNFEQRISQMRMSLEVRMGGIEKQFTSYNKFFADNQRASKLTYTELNENKGPNAAPTGTAAGWGHVCRPGENPTVAA